MGRIRKLLKVVLIGRENGLRARIRRMFRGDPSPAPAAPPPKKADPTPASAPSGFAPAIRTEQLAPGAITEAIVNGVPVAVANVEGTFFAVSNTCPHAGGPIGDGTLAGHTVTCPYHGWSYDVRDGRCFVNPDVKLPTFPVQVIEGQVCVKVA